MKVSLLCLVLSGWTSALSAQQPSTNPRFTFSLGGPCGRTVEGLPGTTYDDGTGGTPFFLDREVYTNTQEEVPTYLPGHTWDAILTTAETPPDNFGTQQWSFGLGMEGALQITEVTTSGTPSCWLGRGPPCLMRGQELSELTGPPDGAGPQTEENRGALTAVLLSFTLPVYLPREGSAAVLKVRALAGFPATEGQAVTGRIFFATRVGSDEYPFSPVVFWPHRPMITPEEGNPPLELEDCLVTFLAANTSRFRRCDPNDDGKFDLSDPIWIFTELFWGRVATPCPAAADCDGDRLENITDGIYALSFLFRGGPAPPAPFPACGRILGLQPDACPFGSTRCGPE